MIYKEFEGYPLPLEPPARRQDLWGPWERYKRSLRLDPCCYCGGIGGTVDHIFAKALHRHGLKLKHKRGPQNWTGACKDCNQAKSLRTPLQFMLDRLR